MKKEVSADLLVLFYHTGEKTIRLVFPINAYMIKDTNWELGG